MTANQIRFQIEGLAKDNGDVQLEDFIKELENIKRALGEMERIVSGSENNLNYRIFELSHNSPTLIGLQAEPNPKKLVDEKIPGEVVQRLIGGIRQIYYHEQPPVGYDFEAYQSITQLTSMVGSKFESIRISNSTSNEDIYLTTPLEPKIETILGPDRVSYGSVTGRLELINLHYRDKIFILYPTIGKGRVKCYYPEELFTQVVNALGKYVKVYGKQKTKKGNYRPYETHVNKIEVYPPGNDLPKLMDLKGIDSELIEDGKSSEQVVREIRVVLQKVITKL